MEYFKKYINIEHFITVAENLDVTLVSFAFDRQDCDNFALTLRDLDCNNLEIILFCHSEVGEGFLQKMISEFPFIAWKVVVYDSFSQVAINHLIEHELKKYVYVHDLRYRLNSMILENLRYRAEYERHACLMPIVEPCISNNPSPNSSTKHPCGYFLASEVFLNFIASIATKPGNTLNFHHCLTKNLISIQGVRCLPIYDTTMEQIDHRTSTNFLRIFEICLQNVNKEISSPKEIYSWKSRQGSRLSTLERFAASFDRSFISPALVTANFSLVCLLQVYNERHNIDAFFENASRHFDAFIVLDDGSTDETYESVNHPKVVLKFKKKRKLFDDKENRNLLLKAAWLINSEWFTFLDADERVFSHNPIKEYIHRLTNADVAGVYLVNVDNGKYISNIRDTNILSKDGILFRWRIFRKVGFMQIRSRDTIHFRVVPFLKNAYSIPVLIHHHVYTDDRTKEKKMQFYESNDENFKRNYDLGIYDILKKDTVLRPIEDVSMQEHFFKVL